MNSNSSTKPGPESNITPALVERVAKLVAKGIPTRIALEGEPVTAAAYKKHLQRHPDLALIQAQAKIKFLDTATDLIASKPTPLLRWLERRFPHVFCDPDDDEKSEAQSKPAPKDKIKLVAGVPEEELEETRQYAQKL